MYLEQCKSILGEDWFEFERIIKQACISDVDEINNIYQHSVSVRGKRLRACLVILLCKALNYNGRKHINLGCIVEWLHAATLIHDDIIDNSPTRSNKNSAHVQFSNTCAVLGGDYLYGLAFKRIAELGIADITSCIAKATTEIIEGEIMQLNATKAANTSEEHYMQVISRKTACLFQVCSETATILAKSELSLVKKFGYHFGMAYQIFDDMQDYIGDPNSLGKNLGNDFYEGKMTLPLIVALRNSSSGERNILLDQESPIPTVVDIINNNGGFEYCKLLIAKHIAAATKCTADLQQSCYKHALELFLKSLSDNCKALS